MRLLLTPLAALLAVSSAATPANAFHFFLPDQSWSLDLDLRQFGTPTLEVSSDLRIAKLEAHAPKANAAVTVRMAPATDTSPAAGRRDAWLEKLQHDGVSLVDLKTFVAGEGACAEFTRIGGSDAAKGFAGAVEKHIAMFFLQDRSAIELHLTKGDFRAERDRAGMERFVSGVTLNAPFVADARDYYLPGELLFRSKQQLSSIPWLARALELEKRGRTLTRVEYLVLIDSLGMAYGMNGELEKSAATFEAGIKEYPEYPWFYYHRACTYAEQHDAERALSNLRLAAERRANVLPGDKLPDPVTDSSFAAYRDDPRFKEIAAAFAGN